MLFRKRIMEDARSYFRAMLFWYRVDEEAFLQLLAAYLVSKKLIVVPEQD